MQWFKICVFHFTETSVEILLCAAAAASVDNMGAFPDGLMICDAVRILCDLHEKTPSIFF